MTAPDHDRSLRRLLNNLATRDDLHRGPGCWGWILILLIALGSGAVTAALLRWIAA